MSPANSSVWTPEEDEKLQQLVDKYGSKRWSLIAQDLKTKGSKQCRRRWKNVIDNKDRNQGAWTKEEDAILLAGHDKYGNKWTEIAKDLIGRTDNAVKNRYAAIQKQREREKRGLDRPRSTSHNSDTNFSPENKPKTKRHCHPDDPTAPHHSRMMKQRHPDLPSPPPARTSSKKPDLSIVLPELAGDDPVQLIEPQDTPKRFIPFRSSGYTPTERQYIDEVNDMDGPLAFLPIDEPSPRLNSLLSPFPESGFDRVQSSHIDDVIIWLKMGLTPQPHRSPLPRNGTPTPRECTVARDVTALNANHRAVLKKALAGLKTVDGAGATGAVLGAGAGPSGGAQHDTAGITSTSTLVDSAALPAAPKPEPVTSGAPGSGGGAAAAPSTSAGGGAGAAGLPKLDMSFEAAMDGGAPGTKGDFQPIATPHFAEYELNLLMDTLIGQDRDCPMFESPVKLHPI